MVQQVASSGGICADREREDTVGAGQSPGALNESLADRGQLLERPQSRSLFRGGALGSAAFHLKLPVEVVSQDCGKEIGLVAQQSSSGDVIHLALGLQLGENRLLGAATMVEGHDMPRREGLVGDHDLELVVVGVGDEEVELNRPLSSDRLKSADDEHPKPAAPVLGLPMGFEVGDLGVEAPPAMARLDNLLQLWEALERHRDREVDAELVQGFDDDVAEEGTVHAHLNVHARQCSTDLVDAGEDELAGTVGIVNVAGAEEEVEDLAGLGDGTEERVVASLAFVLGIESHGRAFGATVGAQHRAVEVEGDAAQAETGEALQDEAAQQVPQLLDHGVGDPGQNPADGGDMRKAAKLQQPQDQGVIVVEAGIPEMSVAEQNVNHEAEDHRGIAIGAGARELAEALAEAGKKIETSEEGLKQDQTGEGGQLLVLESELGESAGFTFDLRSAKLHRGDLLRVGDRFCGKSDSNPSWSLFPFQIGTSQTSPVVRLRKGAQRNANADITEALSYLSTFLMQLEGELRPARREPLLDGFRHRQAPWRGLHDGAESGPEARRCRSRHPTHGCQEESGLLREGDPGHSGGAGPTRARSGLGRMRRAAARAGSSFWRRKSSFWRLGPSLSRQRQACSEPVQA